MKNTLFGLALGVLLTLGMAFTTHQDKKDLSLARVEKVSGKYVFLNCEPVNEYDIAFDVEVKMVLSNSQINSINKISNLVLKKAFKVSEEEKKDFDAMIIKDGQKKDLAIKFK